MKKHFLITLVLLAFAMAATAQTKRIAILETIDKENKVPYAVEVMVRSNLTKVISNTEGYEGYDRVNISQIMDEHDFERTGLVNEEQIRRLGEIAGADYLLISEAVKFDESNIFVTAKILNVESAKTEGSENALMGMTAQEIQHGCESLANMLLRLPTSVTSNDVITFGFNTDSNVNSGEDHEEKLLEEEINSQEQTKKPTIVNNQLENSSYVEDKILITKGKYLYYLGGENLTNNQYLELIKNCPEAWEYYKKGKKQKTAGWITLVSGVSCLIVSILPYDFSYDDEIRTYQLIGGTTLSISSLFLFVIGKGTCDNAYKIYNQYCAQKRTAALSIGPATNSIGLGVYLDF